MTDATGAVLDRHDYLPLGEDASPMTGDPMRFAGKQLDSGTGLQNFEARYYRQTWGRFTQVDPLHVGAAMTDPQEWNRYAYARNNPLRWVDPTGMSVTEYVDVQGDWDTIALSTMPMSPWSLTSSHGQDECYSYNGDGLYFPDYTCLSGGEDFSNPYVPDSGLGQGGKSGGPGPNTGKTPQTGGNGTEDEGDRGNDDTGSPAAPAACAIPYHPPWANVDANIMMIELLKSTPPVGQISAGIFWYQSVDNRGRWDYKRALSGARGQESPFEDFGNFNFGATGAALGLPGNVLLRGAGFAQWKGSNYSVGNGVPWGKKPYGDNPEDQAVVQAGIDYYNQCRP